MAKINYAEQTANATMKALDNPEMTGEDRRHFINVYVPRGYSGGHCTNRIKEEDKANKQIGIIVGGILALSILGAGLGLYKFDRGIETKPKVDYYTVECRNNNYRGIDKNIADALQKNYPDCKTYTSKIRL